MSYNNFRHQPKQSYTPKHSSKPYTGPTRASINKSYMKGWVDVVSPYKKDYVEDLKTVIQPSHRKWDPVKLVWHVNEMFLEELVGLLKMHFDEVITDLAEEEKTVDNIFKPVFEALKNDKDSCDKVYRALAFALHPDHGGTTEQMTKLNQAHDAAVK
jgi:intergrase/recombinase